MWWRAPALSLVSAALCGPPPFGTRTPLLAPLAPRMQRALKISEGGRSPRKPSIGRRDEHAAPTTPTLATLRAPRPSRRPRPACMQSREPHYIVTGGGGMDGSHDRNSLDRDSLSCRCGSEACMLGPLQHACLLDRYSLDRYSLSCRCGSAACLVHLRPCTSRGSIARAATETPPSRHRACRTVGARRCGLRGARGCLG